MKLYLLFRFMFVMLCEYHGRILFCLVDTIYLLFFADVCYLSTITIVFATRCIVCENGMCCHNAVSLSVTLVKWLNLLIKRHSRDIVIAEH